jgi:hypothetical protein
VGAPGGKQLIQPQRFGSKAFVRAHKQIDLPEIPRDVLSGTEERRNS